MTYALGDQPPLEWMRRLHPDEPAPELTTDDLAATWEDDVTDQAVSKGEWDDDGTRRTRTIYRGGKPSGMEVEVDVPPLSQLRALGLDKETAEQVRAGGHVPVAPHVVCLECYCAIPHGYMGKHYLAVHPDVPVVAGLEEEAKTYVPGSAPALKGDDRFA